MCQSWSGLSTEKNKRGVVTQLCKFRKPILCGPIRHHYNTPSILILNFLYNFANHVKWWKCIKIDFCPVNHQSIYYPSIWVWLPGAIFWYLMICLGSKKINLWCTENMTNFVKKKGVQLPFSIFINGSTFSICLNILISWQVHSCYPVVVF